MKYNNKYAIALVLLASSAFCAVSVPSVPDYGALTTAVNKALDGKNKFEEINPTEMTTLKNELTPEQLAAFESSKGDELDDAKIQEILETVYRNQVAEAEKQKAEAEAAAAAALEQEKKDKAEAEKQKAEAEAAAAATLEQEKKDKAEAEKQKAEAEAAAAALEQEKKDKAEAEKQKAEAEAAAAATLEQEKKDKAEAEKQKAEAEAAAAATLEQEKKDKAEPGTNPSSGENTPSPSPNASPSPVDKTEKEKKKVVKVAEENKKLAEQNQKEAEAGADKATADNITKIKAALADVKDFAKLTPEAIKALGLTEKQVEALKKANVSKATTDEDIKKALNAEADATPSAQNKEAKDGADKTTDDPIAKIKAALASVDDFSKLTPEAIKALGLTDKQVEALKKANVSKATTDEDIKKALNAEADATPSAQNKEAKDGADKTTDDPIAKIKAALASVDDFSKLTPEAIKALGLTDKQVEALKKANVTKATTDEDIKKALKGEAETTPNTQNKGAKDINGSGTGDKSEEAEVPFYKNAWIMVPSSVILLSAIGGGVFMMTRKTEDTDL
jgi:predicted DNA binding protein